MNRLDIVTQTNWEWHHVTCVNRFQLSYPNAYMYDIECKALNISLEDPELETIWLDTLVLLDNKPATCLSDNPIVFPEWKDKWSNERCGAIELEEAEWINVYFELHCKQAGPRKPVSIDQSVCPFYGEIKPLTRLYFTD